MIEVELSDGTIAEFPDEMSQSDIKSVLQKKFSPAPSGPSIGDIAAQPQFEIPYSPGMPYGSPNQYAGPEPETRTGMLGEALREIPEPISQGLHYAMQPVEYVAAPLAGYAGIGMAARISQMLGGAGPEAMTGQVFQPGQSVIPGLEPKPEEVGILPSLRRFGAGATTPGMLATAPLVGPSRLAAGAFALGSAATIPPSIAALAEAKTVKEAQGALMDIGLGSLVTAGAGRAAFPLQPEPPITVTPRFDLAQQLENRILAQAAAEAGSPFVRLEPPREITLPPGMQGPVGVPPVSMGVRTQPNLSMEFDPQGRVIGETFDPSGIRIGEPVRPIEIPPELALLDWQARLAERRRAEAAQLAGSPFLREAPTGEPISMGVRTAPFPGVRRTYRPSGLEVSQPTAPEPAGAAQAAQPPSPPMAPGPRPATATRAIRLRGEAAQRLVDWEKAMAEKVAQDQAARLHPDKPLTENQLRIIRESLTQQILEGQIPGERSGIISGSALEKWADKTLADESWRKNTSMNPFGAASKAGKNTAAFIVKGAALLERGIVDFGKWSAEMVKEFGESIRPFLENIRSQSDQVRGALEARQNIRKSESSDLFISTPTFKAVNPSVFRTAENAKVFDSIINDVPIDVMNMLGGKQSASDMLFHNPSVLFDTLSRMSPDQVSRILASAEVVIAGRRAKLSSDPSFPRRNAEITSALNAAESNLNSVIDSLRHDVKLTVRELSGQEKTGGEKNALQREAETVLRDVQQPQVAQEGAGRVPASEGGTPTPEARQENVIALPDSGGHILKLTHDGPTAKNYTVLNSDGAVVGNVQVSFFEDTGKWHVSSIGTPLARGKGLGRKATIIASKDLNKPLYSDVSLSPEGESAWKAIATGKEILNDGNEYYKFDPKSKGGDLRGLQEKGKEKEVTPTAPVTEAPTKSAMDILDEYYKTHPRGRRELESSVKYQDPEGVLYKSEARELMGSALSTSPNDLPGFFKKRAKSLDEPESFYAALIKVARPEITDFQLSIKQLEQLKAWQDSLLKPKSKSDILSELTKKLESLKLPETGEGRLYSLPHPDAIKAIGRSTWNSAIDLAIGAIKAGKAIGEAIEIALSHIRKNAAGKFDEAKARANLEWTTKQEVRSAVPSTEGENVQMRKSAERATTSPMVPEPVQERIATAPESFYTQQSMKRVEDAVAGMDEGQLAAVPRDSNLYTAARLEQAKRLFERGENEAGYRVFEELEKEGTMMGQLINQFKLLKGTRPENIVRVINQTLKKSGKDILNEKQTGEAMEIAKQSKDADAALDKATDVWQLEPTTENAVKAEQALLDANAAGLKLQRFINRFQPRSTAGVIKSVLQGNLLTPISEVANIVGNIMFLPFRAGVRSIASAMDVLDNYIKGTPRQITVQPIRGTIEAAKGAARGALQIPDIFMRGTGNVIKGESRAGLHPLKAWINQFSKNPELPTTGGKLTLGDRLNLLIEGTFGIPAEAMLRGLGVGDVPFKEAARARATATELKLANVPKAQWSFAQKFPELFLDAKAMERIKDQTLAAVFQRPSTSLNRINSIIRNNFLTSRGVSPDIMDLAASTVAPYRLTPWNVVGEILSFNPLVAAARSVNDFRIGNRLDAKLNAGKYIVGTMLTAAGWWLYKNGLMSPSLDQRDEAQKTRILFGEVMPPNHINLSGLKRALAGGDPAFRKGDETRDVFRAGGLAGSMFYMTANIGRDFERMPEVKDQEILGAILRQSTLEQARFGMNQSFLSGVEGLLSAVREGNADNYLRQWANTVASVPIPNSLTVLSRATRDYKPDFREDAFSKQVENVIRNKLGVAKMDDYLPLKRGLWGEPLRETPEGRNALIYHFFDVFKGKQVTGDPVPLELFRLFRQTTDSRVIPSLPEKTITVGGKTYALSAAEQSRYAELVGQSRRRIVDAVVVNPGFHKIPDEAKINILEKIYDAGLRQGKAQFWVEAGSTLKEKPARAGFQPAAPAPPQ